MKLFSKIKGKNIDWLNHFMEFIVVIIGILIAFQLNQCSIERERQRLVDTHLEQIVKETQVNKEFFNQAIQSTETNLSKLDTLFRLIEQRDNIPKINLLALELLNLGGIYIRKNAYLSLTEAGDFKYIQSFDRKQAIINLYEYYEWVESFNEMSMLLYRNDYYPYLQAHFDIMKGTVQEEDIYFSKSFKNILSAYYRTSQNKLQKYRDGLAEIEAYLEGSGVGMG